MENSRVVVRLEPDFREYLRHRKVLFSPKVDEVVTDVVRFASASILEGFRTAFGRVTTETVILSQRPFIQVCEIIIEHHLRIVAEVDRELIGKSLFEAYTHFAGPQRVFEPISKTRFMTMLRRRGPRDLAALFLSLHVFNVVCMDIQDKVVASKPDLKSVELYMRGVEAVCSEVLNAAMKLPIGLLDERWAALVCCRVEGQLLSL